jgi:hypothetical protein
MPQPDNHQAQYRLQNLYDQSHDWYNQLLLDSNSVIDRYINVNERQEMGAYWHLADCSVGWDDFHSWCDYQSDLCDLRMEILTAAMISCKAIPVEIAEQFL